MYNILRLPFGCWHWTRTHLVAFAKHTIVSITCYFIWNVVTAKRTTQNRNLILNKIFSFINDLLTACIMHVKRIFHIYYHSSIVTVDETIICRCKIYDKHTSYAILKNNFILYNIHSILWTRKWYVMYERLE